jgi:hypothetical protein
LKPKRKRGITRDMMLPATLVPLVRCVVEPPCEVCAYCKTAKYGPGWWLR